MATTKDDLSDKHVDTASAEVGEASGAGDDVLLVEGNTRLSLTDKDLVVTRELYPGVQCRLRNAAQN